MIWSTVSINSSKIIVLPSTPKKADELIVTYLDPSNFSSSIFSANILNIDSSLRNCLESILTTFVGEVFCYFSSTPPNLP